MRNPSWKYLTLGCLLSLAIGLAATADTIRLKNGREITGRVASYGNGEFTLYVPSKEGGPGHEDRMILLVDTIDSIKFDTSATASLPAAGPTGASAPAEELIVLDATKEAVPTGVHVQRGDRVRVTASGQMQFSDGRVTGPAGLESRESWPFPGERFGVLIAVIGDPMSSSIYHVIGEENDFEARKDGEVFLQINARSLQGARGAYTARVQVLGDTSPTAATPTPASEPAASGPRQLRRDFEVPANREWLDTGVDLLQGDTLSITAEGTIHYTSAKTCGPDGGERTWGDLLRALHVNDAGRGALIGLIGQPGVARAFFIGSRGEFKVEQTGRLYLGINDDNYQNNEGSYQVHVEIVPSSR
jgi:hypothetical protein